MDKEGILAADRDKIFVTANYDAEPVCTTGAGDSSTAAIVWAYLLNHDEDYLITASKASNAAAAMTVEVQESINNDITPELLLHRVNGSGVNIDIIK
jgi:fructose-1-phosphate kinase PfkB-like protein